jgi:hypothetical protein
MLSRELARELLGAGLRWVPTKGDRFFVPDRDLDDHVFVLSDMVIELVDVPDGSRILAFNGTTEWALDSILAHEVVWLPREEQLRELLGEAFVSLLATPGGFVVVVDRNGVEERHIDIDAECALARAVLDVRAASQDQ